MLIHLLAVEATTMLDPLLSPGGLDENAAHGFAGGSKEMTAAVPALFGLRRIPARHQSQVRLVDQCGCFQCLPRLFLGQLVRSEFAQLVVHERQELSGSLEIAVLNS